MGHKVKQSLMSSRVDFFYYAFRNILLVGIPLVIVSALILGLTTSHSSADTASSDDITLKLDVACTVSSVVTSPHSALDMNVGQYKTDIGNTNISVFCNDNNGYSVYAIGNSNSTDGNSDLISNINEKYNIHTGTNTTGNSSWSMKLTAGTGTGSETTPPSIVNGYNNYSLIPNNYTLVATRPSGTSMNPDTSASGSYFSTTYAIYAASTQPAGTYNGKVKYVMVHPDNSTHNTIPDIEAAFAMAGKQKYPQESGAYYAMQDMTTDICNSVSRNGEITSTQLVDLRDNKLYWVTKLKDGHCWMTQNLDTDINPSISFNSNNTDLNVAYDSSTGQYAEYDDGYTENNEVIYWTPADSAATIDFTGTTVTGWQNSSTAPYTANKTDDIETGHASLGNYYNWSAAIASNNSSSLTQNTLSDISKNPKNSICPKGWRLPTISNQSKTIPGSTNEFARLNYLYNPGNQFSALINSPLSFVLSSYIADGIISGGFGVKGMYRSSSIAGASAYGFAFNASYIDTQDITGQNRGIPIRCIAR